MTITFLNLYAVGNEIFASTNHASTEVSVYGVSTSRVRDFCLFLIHS